MNPCVIGYVPPPSVGCAQAFWDNINTHPTKYPLILFSDHPWGDDVVRLKASPEFMRTAKYPNGQPNPWALNNILFLVALKMAKDRGFSHILYIEADCRVRCPQWDDALFNEFQAGGPDTLMGGSIVCYQPCNRDREFSEAWTNFLRGAGERQFVVPAFGGLGASETPTEKQEPAVFPNGALAVYDLEFCLSVCKVENQAEEAARITAFDYHLGRELVRKYGADTFKRIVHFNFSYSGYGNMMFTEEERQKLLTDQQVVAVHQIKSGWRPELSNLVGSVAEKGKAGDAGGRTPSAGSSPAAAPTSYDVPMEPPPAPEKPVVSIFIVSFARDAHWLKHCVRSVEKFASGFLRTVIAVPKSEEVVFFPQYGNRKGVRLVYYDDPPVGAGYLNQQAVKCKADLYDQDANYFLFLDSDCIFTEPVTPADYFVGNKPVLLIESYKALADRKDPAVVWQDGTQKALGDLLVTHETMRRHPAVHHRGLLQELRFRISETHQNDFHDYIMRQRPVYPSFSEFNAMGSLAMRQWEETYHFIDIGLHPDQRPADKLMQFWSRGPIDKPQQIGQHGRRETIKPTVPMEVITRILG